MAEVQTRRSAARRGAKSAAAFRTISEVAADLDLPQHVLRFWESKFPQIRPLKRGGGRRYYRPEDIVLLRRIRNLLHEDGYTIRGVQKLLRQNGAKATSAHGQPAAGVVAGGEGSLPPHHRAELEAVLSELETLRDLLAAPDEG